MVLMSSAVSECSCVREFIAAVVGRGMLSERVARRGRRSSMVSSSGGRVPGEKRG